MKLNPITLIKQCQQKLRCANNHRWHVKLERCSMFPYWSAPGTVGWQHLCLTIIFHVSLQNYVKIWVVILVCSLVHSYDMSQKISRLFRVLEIMLCRSNDEISAGANDQYFLCLSVTPICMIMMTSSNGNIFRVTGHLCGEFTGPGEFTAQRQVTWSFDVFFVLSLNKRLSKYSQSRPLWRHCNAWLLQYQWSKPRRI